MVVNIRIPFKLDDKNDHYSQAGLRIVPQISSQNHHSSHSNNVVLKSAVMLRQPITTTTSNSSNNKPLDSHHFLKTCNLCHKGLRLDKEIYMYRGDQGFCSEECRSKQIYKDEMKELEASTKKMVEAYRNNYSCNSSSSDNETRSILEDLIHSRQTYMNTNQNRKSHNRAIFIF